MMMKKILVFSVMILSLSIMTARAYLVKKGDTLSQICEQQFGKSVYGKNGSLNKALAANPNIRNPDRISVGDEIIFIDGKYSINPTAQTNFHTQSISSSPSTPTPTPIEEASKDKATTTPKTTPQKNISIQGNVGPTYSVIDQNGALGSFKHGALNVGFGADILGVFGNKRVEFEYRNVNSILVNESKSLQSLELKAGLYFIFIGIDDSIAPIGSFVQNDVNLQNLMIISPVIGTHFDWGHEEESSSPYRSSVDFEAEIPALTNATHFSERNVRGFGLRLRGAVKRKIYSAYKLDFYLGVSGEAQYQHIQFDGSYDSISGNVSRNIQLYQASMNLKAEL